jgi:hypothetical protein
LRKRYRVAQWRAAAQTPVVLKESLELLQSRLAEYSQQTATLLKNFDNVTDTKTKTIEGVITRCDNSFHPFHERS